MDNMLWKISVVEIVDLERGRTKSKGMNTEKAPGLLQEYRYMVLAFQLSTFSVMPTSPRRYLGNQSSGLMLGLHV